MGCTEPGCAWVVTGLAFICWAGFAWIGYSFWSNAAARFPDSPYLAGQWRGYVGIPLVAATIAALQAFALFRWRWLARPVVVVSFFLLFGLLAFMVSYGGGV